MSVFVSKPQGEKPKPSRTPQVFLNARLIDPESGRDELGGLLVQDGLIADLGPHLRRNAPEGAAVIDCQEHVLCPGLIDAQVTTGEPGQEHRETLKTASQAAAAGGGDDRGGDAGHQPGYRPGGARRLHPAART